MISKTRIIKELKKIETLYDKASYARNADLRNFYSKLALLEFCGWIEQSIDNITSRIKKKLKKNENIQYVESIIKQTSSFTYDKHFRKTLIKTFGIFNVEQIEKKIDVNKKDQLRISLNNLKKIRDDHAHTYVYGTTAKFWAPSYTVSFFNKVYDGLREFEKQLTKI